MRVGALVILVAAAGCGDDAVTGPATLVPDPAVETGCTSRPGAGETRAKVISCDDELIGGRLASGRLGDLLLENEHVRVILRAGDDGQYLLGTGGGGIIDAATVGGEDLVKEIVPAIDLASVAADEQVITEAGDDGAAEIVIRGPARGIEVVTAALGNAPPDVIVEHHYRLAAGASAVELETRIYAPADRPATGHDLYDAMFLGGRARTFLPRRGFAPGSFGAEIIATSGTTTSYGLVYPTGTIEPQLTDLAGIRLVRGPNLLDDGTPSTRWLILGDGSVSSVIDAAWALRGAAVGTIHGTTVPGVDVAVYDGDEPVTIARADAAGAYTLTVPPGAYTLRAEGVGRDRGDDVSVEAAAGVDLTQAIPAGPSGTVALTVRDDAATLLPARVVVSRAGEDDRILYVGATGDLTVPVAPGTWRITVSRGLEYDAAVFDPVTIADGVTTPLDAVLEHVIDSAGWIALDTHLHSELSTDSTLPVDDRLRAVAAEGVEVPVSTDHDYLTDYAPIITELGLDDWLGTMVGEEATSLIWGHVNGFPLTIDADRAGNGAAHWIGRTPGEVFAQLHDGDGDRIVQINHPRQGSASLFDAIDLDPVTLTARRDPRELGLDADADLNDLSFDAIEICNRLDDEDFEEIFADYLALVAAGHPAAATGSSDSHAASAFAGEARTYVYVGAGNDDPATVDPQAIVEAIRARHVVVATGSFVTAGIVTATGVSLPGDTVDVTGQADVHLHVTIQAAPWQALTDIKIYDGTQLAQVITLDPLDVAAIRYDADVVLPTPIASTSYVVRVDVGDGDPVLDGDLPSVTNPVFAHVD